MDAHPGTKDETQPFHWLLNAIVVGGGVMAWRTGGERSRPTARHERLVKLIVADAKKIAVVKLDDEWIDESRWDIHLPNGPLRLCLATREIAENGLAPVVKSERITSGTHRLVLAARRDRNPWQATVLCDGRELIVWAASHDPKSNPGATTTSADVSQSKQLSPAGQVVLLRRRFHQADGNGGSCDISGPTNGVLLWIEPTP
jgi:hypothetical protein